MAPDRPSDCKHCKLFTFPCPRAYIMAVRTAGVKKLRHSTCVRKLIRYCRTALSCNRVNAFGIHFCCGWADCVRRWVVLSRHCLQRRRALPLLVRAGTSACPLVRPSVRSSVRLLPRLIYMYQSGSTEAPGNREVLRQTRSEMGSCDRFVGVRW